jgi:hypothetical protein
MIPLDDYHLFLFVLFQSFSKQYDVTSLSFHSFIHLFGARMSSSTSPSDTQDIGSHSPSPSPSSQQQPQPPPTSSTSSAVATFPLLWFDGVLILQLSNGVNALLDTGSPTSYGSVGTLSILDETFPRIASSYLAFTAQKLSEHHQFPIHVALGTDILVRFDVLIDTQRMRVEFARNKLLACSGSPVFVTVDLQFVMGVPVVNCLMASRALLASLDLGSKLSYALPQTLAAGNHRALGPVIEYHPMSGHFTTSTWSVPVTVAGETLRLRVGQLPQMLQAAAQLSGCEGAIGSELLTNYNCFLSLSRAELVLMKHQ